MRVKILAFIAAFLAGILVGRWHPGNGEAKRYAMPERRLESGALVIARTPDQAPKASIPEIPENASVVSVQSITFKPDSLEPVEIKIARIDTPDGLRTVADASHGTITGGMDYAGNEERTGPKSPWAIGPAGGWTNGKLSAGIAATYTKRRWQGGIIANKDSIYGFWVIRF